MADASTAPRRRLRRRPKLEAAGCCLLLPVVAFALTFSMCWSNNRPVQVALPTPVVPNPNGYDDFVRAGTLVRGMRHISPFSMSRPTFTYADFRDCAKDARPALAAVRQGLGREYLNPPISSPRGAAGFAVYASFREVARTQSAVATFYEMDGKPALATETRLDALEMGVVIPRGGQMLSALVGIACEAIAMSAIEPQLPKLTEPELAHVAQRLDRIAARRVPFADVLQEEGYWQIRSDLELINDAKGYRNLDAIRGLLAEDDPNAALGTKKPLTLKQNWEAVRFLMADKGAIMRDNQAYNAALVREARGPYTGTSRVRAPDNLLAKTREGLFTQAHARFAGMEAAHAVLRTEVALLRYKKAHGSFPRTLDMLTPTYIPPAAMLDPFTGNALRYRLSGGEFVLYSIGSDLKDDNGSPARYVGAGNGDIVAGKLWPNRRKFSKQGAAMQPRRTARPGRR